MGGTLPVGKVTPHMRVHPLLSAAMGDRRRRLLASATGRVLDVGGFDENAQHYAPGVTVHDVEPEELASMTADGFDTVVCTMVLCTIDDLAAGLAEIRRLTAPGGRLLFLEHVRGGAPRALLQGLSRPVWSRLFSGCHPDRDTVAAVRDAGFHISDLDRFTFRAAAPVISPGVSGIARLK